MSHRDRESGERHHRDQYPSAGTPHHSNAGSLPIHQPVASRVPGAIHSPGGLLANHGGSAPSVPLGAPSGPANSYGGPMPGDANRPHPHNAQSASNQMFGAIGGHNAGPAGSSGGPGPVFGGPLQQEGNRPNQGVPFTSGGPGAGSAGGPASMAGGGAPIPANSSALPQGQQPILNVSCSRESPAFLLGNVSAPLVEPRLPSSASSLNTYTEALIHTCLASHVSMHAISASC